MNEFLFSILKGIQLPLLFFAAIGIYSRIRQKKWTSFDSLLLAAFLLYTVFTAFQVYFFYKILTTSARYILPGVPLYLPFAAMGAITVWNYCKKRKDMFIILLVLGSLFAVSNLYRIYSPRIKRFTSRKQYSEMMISMKVAGFIRMDWEKTVSQKTPRIRVWKSDVYQSGKRPLVSSPYTRIGFLCGGQQIPDFMLYAGYPVDYYVFDKGFTVPDRYEVAGKIIWDGKEVFIYKKASEQ